MRAGTAGRARSTSMLARRSRASFCSRRLSSFLAQVIGSLGSPVQPAAQKASQAAIPTMRIRMIRTSEEAEPVAPGGEEDAAGPVGDVTRDASWGTRRRGRSYSAPPPFAFILTAKLTLLYPAVAA